MTDEDNGFKNGSVILDLDSPDISQLVYTKTNIGGWFFDAFLKMEHTSRLTITEHPVQAGAAVSDHAFLQPRELSMDVAMSNVHESSVPGQFSGGYSRSVQAFYVLKELQQLRVPIQIHTRLGLYRNMMVEVLSAPDDFETLDGLHCSVTFKELNVAQVRTVKISSRPTVTDTSKRGSPEPITPNQSALSQMGLGKLLFGQ
ncbi:phage baseplate protein [Paenibacillus filicis]|uniref:Phage baseplate protein n=1 Tax=Paenibacillus filicis TaxID=669464 RepID=A0ABU9DIG0_9BACL